MSLRRTARLHERVRAALEAVYASKVEDATAVWLRSVYQLACGIASLINVVDPEVVILGVVGRDCGGDRKSLRVGLPTGILLDVVAQYLLFRSVRIVGAIIVGTLLIAVPYAMARGLTSRIVRLAGRRKTARNL